MAYDHSKKIGNEGDLIKHAVLHACLNQLLDAHQNVNAFRYIDAHCGRAEYVLPASGEWQRGIGDFSKLGWGTLSADDRQARQSLLPYFNEHLTANLCSAQKYFGSSGIAFRILRRRLGEFGTLEKVDYFLDLYDREIHVCDDLLRYFGPATDKVKVTNGDGFAAVQALEANGASLVLIDPPDRKFEPVVAAVNHLADKGIPYICWTTRFSEQGKEIEHDESRVLVHELPNAAHLAVRWMKPTGSNQSPFGCRLTVSDDLFRIAESVVDQLVRVMPERKMTKPQRRINELPEEFELRQSLERTRKWERL